MLGFNLDLSFPEYKFFTKNVLKWRNYRERVLKMFKILRTMAFAKTTDKRKYSFIIMKTLRITKKL